MDTEEQLMGMMVIADEQQHAIDQLIQNARDEQTKLAENNRETNQQTVTLVRNTLHRLEQENEQLFHWHSIAVHIAIVACSALIIFGMLFLYVDYQTNKLAQIKQAIHQLEAVNADISRCEYHGKKYPCVKVMRLWGSYGENRDVFILDTK